MKNQLAKLFMLSQKVNRQHIQVVFMLLTLVLFVLGASAPDDAGVLPRR
jgi:hypothetical protein